MKVYTSVIWFVCLCLGLSACSKGPDVRHISADFRLVPFYQDIHSIPVDSVKEYVPKLKEKYGNFLEGYSIRVIRIGSVSDSMYPEYLRSFIEYEANKDVFDVCKKQYSDLESLEEQIKTAFQHYLYYFPQKPIPDVYLHISGFNQSMIADSGIISISIEKYLGVDCRFYELLAFPKYLRKKMIPEKIVPDLMKAMAYTEFPFNDSIDNVANNLIYNGKALWFVKQMMPDIPDTLLFDYSKDELNWCKKNEEQMWASMVENKHVFNNERMVIQKYVGDAPFTYFFGQDSPGHAGVFIGYQIVKVYMLAHPEITIEALMLEEDGHKILAASGYRP